MKWIWRSLVAVVALLVVVVVGLMAAAFREGAGKMASSVVINRPPAEIWPHLVEPAKLKAWVGWLIDVEEPEGPIRGEGSRQIWKMEDRNNNNAIMRIEGKVTGYEKDRRLLVHTVAPGGFYGDQLYRLESVENGSTRLVAEAQYTFDHWFAKLLEPLIMPQASKKFSEDLNRLKSIVEAQPHS